MKSKLIILFIAGMATFTSCKKDAPAAVYNGAPVPIGKGTAHTFISLDENGKPSTIGIRLSADALNGLPSEGNPDMGGMVPGYMLSLPGEAGSSGFDHCEVDWNPHGHEPLFAYGVPHFDFHFYMISPQEQSQVIPGPDTIPVEPQYIPKDYISGVMAVPDMGTHWSDTTAPEFNGKPFTATFIYGFYHGNMTFLEPMITEAYLETKPDYTFPIKQPEAFQHHGYYPTKTHLYYDNQNNEFVIALEQLTYK
jgi:hypothetical protein